MLEPCKADDVLFHGGGRRGGVGDVVVGGRGGEGLVPETAARLGSGVSRVSLCSSMSSLTNDDDDDNAESFFPVVGDRTWSSSEEEEEEEDDTTLLQLDGDDGGGGGGPLYELSPLLAHLPVRTGLSKYYQGKSQSFTSLTDVKCVDDLAKKNVPRSSRMKACRGYAASGTHSSRSSILSHFSGPYSKTIAKKTMAGVSSDRLLSRARSTGILRSSGKPPAYQRKKELYCSYAD